MSSPIVLDRFATPLLAGLLCAACTRSVSEPDPSQEPSEARRAPPPPAADDPWTVSGAELCDADSEALADARARHDALDSMAEGLDPAADPKAFVGQLEALYEHPCLAVGRGDQPRLDLDAATGIEAKLYWQSGLDMWFRTYLDVADGTDNTVWLLPSPPQVVTPQTRPDDPLAPWMCSADPDDPCAQRVAAWRSRAQRFFALFEHGGKPASLDCEPALRDGPEQGAYLRWRACERKGLQRQASLPVGGLGLIHDGWIVVYGRRGHYQYCDELAAFDLASGAHYRFADCDHRPELDLAATVTGIEVETGTIATEPLQEAAWVMLSVPYVQDDVVTDRALGRELPAGIRMALPPAPISWSGVGIIGTGSSGHTTLGWIWTRGSKQTPAHGELSWPDGLSDPADDHAVRLLALAEQRTVPGCAPAKLPAWILEHLTAEQLPESEDDVVDPPSAELLAAVRIQLARGRCAKP